jgi:hypothetical protein
VLAQEARGLISQNEILSKQRGWGKKKGSTGFSMLGAGPDLD